MTSAELFQKLEAVQFYFDGVLMGFACGEYPLGNRGAAEIVVVDPSLSTGGHEHIHAGETWTRLTVNLVTEEIAHDEFHVKHTPGGEGCAKMLGQGGEAFRFVVDTGVSVAQGYVGAYATIWKFTTCDKDGGYRVECGHCHLLHQEFMKQEQERLRALDSVRRLQGRGDIR